MFVNNSLEYFVNVAKVYNTSKAQLFHFWPTPSGMCTLTIETTKIEKNMPGMFHLKTFPFLYLKKHSHWCILRSTLAWFIIGYIFFTFLNATTYCIKRTSVNAALLFRKFETRIKRFGAFFLRSRHRCRRHRRRRRRCRHHH